MGRDGVGMRRQASARAGYSYTPRVPTAISVTAPLILATVFVVSAVGKLRAPDRAREAFTAMGVPRWLDQPAVARAHPWVEILLAIMLVVAPGPLAVIAAAAALVLMLVYVALVVRALRGPVDVDCACFGSLGSDRITQLTVWRNVWLSGLAGLVLWSGFDGRSVVTRLSALDAPSNWWLAAALGTAVTVGLVLSTGTGTGSKAGNDGPGGDVEPEDYVRTRTPAVPITLPDGSTTDLRRLSAQRAQLLLYVSEGCGSCRDIIASAPQWHSSMPQIDIRLVVGLAPEASSFGSTSSVLTAHDPDRLVRESFGLSGLPSAILLGADGMLAGGPITGRAAVEEFVADIQHELRSGPADLAVEGT